MSYNRDIMRSYTIEVSPVGDPKDDEWVVTLLTKDDYELHSVSVSHVETDAAVLLHALPLFLAHLSGGSLVRRMAEIERIRQNKAAGLAPLEGIA